VLLLENRWLRCSHKQHEVLPPLSGNKGAQSGGGWRMPFPSANHDEEKKEDN
jgi:hypothetical protein